jgi:hypothetical protein
MFFTLQAVSFMQDQLILEGERKDRMHLTVCMAAADVTLFSVSTSKEMPGRSPGPFDHQTQLPRVPSFVSQSTL